MQSEWQAATVGAVSLVVTKGTTPTTLGHAFQDTGINFVKVESISPDGRFIVDKLVRISREAHEALARSKLAPNDVLFTIAGTIGRTAIVTDEILPANTNQAVAIVRPNTALVHPRFLRYVLSNPAFLRGVLSRTVESVQANFSLGELKSASILLPNLREQQVITEVLGSIDDRIDLLRQTNATLESIAQALFKSWFIDFDPVRAKAEGREPEGMNAAMAALFPAEFGESALGLIPKGWGVCLLSDVLELSYGKALKVTDRRDGQVPVYGSGGITGFHDKALVQSGAIIVGRKGTVGSLYWEDRPFFPIDTTFYVKPKTAPMTFCFYALQRLGLESMNTDAAVPGLNRENAYRLKLIKVPSPVLVAFDELASTIRSTMRCNDERAALLASLRNSLLPRLISGKLRLPEAKEQVEYALA